MTFRTPRVVVGVVPFLMESLRELLAVFYTIAVAQCREAVNVIAKPLI